QALAVDESMHGLLRLAVDNEIGGVGEQLGHLRGGEADEANTRAARTHFAGPGRFTTKIDEGRKNQGDVAIDEVALRGHDFMTGSSGYGSKVCKMNAVKIVKPPLDLTNNR